MSPMSESDLDTDDREAEAPPSPDVISVLVANHREFLTYVERRVGDRALAEEILQEAFVKSLDKADQIRDSAVGWFWPKLCAEVAKIRVSVPESFWKPFGSGSEDIEMTDEKEWRRRESNPGPKMPRTEHLRVYPPD